MSNNCTYNCTYDGSDVLELFLSNRKKGRKDALYYNVSTIEVGIFNNKGDTRRYSKVICFFYSDPKMVKMEDLSKVFDAFIQQSYRLEKEEIEQKQEIEEKEKYTVVINRENKNEKQEEKEETEKKEKEKEKEKIYNSKKGDKEKGNEHFFALQKEEDSLDDGWTGSILIYEEYSLSGLYICEEPLVLENDKTYYALINVLTKSTDIHNECEWIDYYYNKKEQTQEINILKPGRKKEEYIFREYKKPDILKNVCIFRRSSSCIFKTSEIETVDAKTICEQKIPKYTEDTFNRAGFYLSHTLFVKVNVFHKNYGNSDHLMVLVMRHYKDPLFQKSLFNDRVLIQVKSNFTSRKYAKMKHFNILQYAQMLKPYLSLRKLDETIVEEQKEQLGFFK